jgi:hypothetical protein
MSRELSLLMKFMRDEQKGMYVAQLSSRRVIEVLRAYRLPERRGVLVWKRGVGILVSDPLDLLHDQPEATAESKKFNVVWAVIENY